MKTLFFEKRLGVKIEDFSTTKKVDKAVEKHLGKKLKIAKTPHDFEAMTDEE